MSGIVLGVDGSERSEDAVAFGRLLAQASGAPVILATAYPLEPAAARDASNEYGDFLRREAEGMLQRMAASLHDLAELELCTIADRSPARALQDLAGKRSAGVIVVGSSHTGKAGRVLPGSTAERLLHGSPCAVTVVPRDYRTTYTGTIETIGCAWDGRPEADAALAAAEDLTRRLSASLRVVRVLEPEHRVYPSELGERYGQVIENARERARRALETRVAHLSAAVHAEGVLDEGEAARALIAASALVDVLVIGSRGYGPLRAVLLGGVSGKVIRSASCPVIAIPNGARSAIGSVFAPTSFGVGDEDPSGPDCSSP